MYAIIEVGAKQYSVKKDDIIDVEKQSADKGKVISLNKVLLVSKDKKVDTKIQKIILDYCDLKEWHDYRKVENCMVSVNYSTSTFYFALETQGSLDILTCLINACDAIVDDLDNLVEKCDIQIGSKNKYKSLF